MIYGAFDFFNLEHINGFHIRAAENSRILFVVRDLTAIAQNINIRKSYMTGHRTETAALRVKIKTVTYLMTSVAWPLS